jgi:hypothetical protein
MAIPSTFTETHVCGFHPQTVGYRFTPVARTVDLSDFIVYTTVSHDGNPVTETHVCGFLPQL